MIAKDDRTSNAQLSGILVDLADETGPADVVVDLELVLAVVIEVVV